VPGPGNKPLYECTFDPSTQDPATVCGQPNSPGNCVTPNQNGPYSRQARLELGGVGCMYDATPRDYIDMRVKPINWGIHLTQAAPQRVRVGAALGPP